MDGAGTLVLRARDEPAIDPVTLSVLSSALSGIAEEMGAVLIRGAYSSNIKERRDCSAALFDADGRMVAQAEHIPVHLGAMPEAVAAVIARDPEPGDVFAVNDPFSGGTHLPDITLVSPMAVGGDVLGYAVTRAHHSDVGGMSPGSMPAGSHELFQEGLVIPPVRLVRGGAYVPDVLDLILANVRTPDIRRGDLRAQIAANRLAEQRLAELVERRGRDTVAAVFSEVIAYTERRTRETLRGLPDGSATAESEIEGDGVDRRRHPDPRDGHARRRRARDRLRRHRRGGRRERELHDRGHALGLPVRAARAAPARRAGQRGRVRAARHPRAGGLARRRPPAVGRRRRQRGDEPARGGHGARRAGAGSWTASPRRARGP